MATSTHGDLQRQHRALNALLLAVACWISASLTLAPIMSVRPKLDSAGKRVLRPDGSPARERGYMAEIELQPLPHALFALGVFFVARAAVIRFRRVPSNSDAQSA